MREIGPGSRGLDVTLAQRLLNRRMGGGTMGLDETGEYGERMRRVLAEFHKRERITTERDVIGAHTWSALGLGFDVNHGLPLIPLIEDEGAWAAAAAMAAGLPSVVGFEEIVPPPGVDLGGFRSLRALESLAGRFFWSVSPAPRSTGELLSLCQGRPAWLAGTTETGRGHGVTIAGAMGDGSDDATYLLVNDPLPYGIGWAGYVTYRGGTFETGGGQFTPAALVVP